MSLSNLDMGPGVAALQSWAGPHASAFGSNVTVVDKVLPDMLHMIDPHWWVTRKIPPLRRPFISNVRSLKEDESNEDAIKTTVGHNGVIRHHGKVLDNRYLGTIWSTRTLDCWFCNSKRACFIFLNETWLNFFFRYQFPPMNPLWHGLLGFVIGVLGFISLTGNGMVMYIFTSTKVTLQNHYIFIFESFMSKNVIILFFKHC